MKFSPNGLYVLTVSRQDGTARVWDRDGGDPVYVMGAAPGSTAPRSTTRPARASIPMMWLPPHLAPTASLWSRPRRRQRPPFIRWDCGDFDDLKHVAELGWMGLRVSRR